MSQPLNVIIVEKTGTLKSLLVKDFKEEELFKKCGFKKAEDFVEQIEWSVKLSGVKYYVKVFAKTDGRANNENKYDFPPPIDTKLFFGNCAVVAFLKDDKKEKKDKTGKKDKTEKNENNDKRQWVDLTLELWEKIYEKLFGGFEDLTLTAAEDEEEEDELANVPKERKTKDGYLKDGFVVDSSETDENDVEDDSETDGEDEDEDEEDDEDEGGEVLLELGSELSEEEYDYSDNSKE